MAAIVGGPNEGPAHGAVNKRRTLRTREGVREAGNGSHFLRQDTVFFWEASWTLMPQRLFTHKKKNTFLSSVCCTVRMNTGGPVWKQLSVKLLMSEISRAPGQSTQSPRSKCDEIKWNSVLIVCLLFYNPFINWKNILIFMFWISIKTIEKNMCTPFRYISIINVTSLINVKICEAKVDS